MSEQQTTKLTISEAVSYLRRTHGLNKPRGTIWDWVKKGSLPATKIGAMWYVEQRHLDALIGQPNDQPKQDEEIDDDRVDNAEEECQAEGV